MTTFVNKQLEMLLKIEWKIPSITLASFLDHYVRILPDSTEPKTAITKDDSLSPFQSPISAPTVVADMQSAPVQQRTPRSKLLKAIKGEILE